MACMYTTYSSQSARATAPCTLPHHCRTHKPPSPMQTASSMQFKPSAGPQSLTASANASCSHQPPYLEAFAGSSLRVDRARHATKPPRPTGTIGASLPPTCTRQVHACALQAVATRMGTAASTLPATACRCSVHERITPWTHHHSVTVPSTNVVGCRVECIVGGCACCGDGVVGAHEALRSKQG